MKLELKKETDVHYLTLTADDGVSVMTGFHREMLSRSSGLEALDFIAHELRGCMRAIDDRRARNPQVAQRIRVPDLDGPRMVMRVDRSDPKKPLIWVGGDDGGLVEVDWSKCKYLDEA